MSLKNNYKIYYILQNKYDSKKRTLWKDNKKC